jgi:hypothetical protein
LRILIVYTVKIVVKTCIYYRQCNVRGLTAIDQVIIYTNNGQGLGRIPIRRGIWAVSQFAEVKINELMTVASPVSAEVTDITTSDAG